MDYVRLSAEHVAQCELDLEDCDTCQYALIEERRDLAEAIINLAWDLICPDPLVDYQEKL